MDDKLKEFLENLDDNDAEEIWAWLDNYPEAVDRMISIIANSHPNL
jgi:hypothetical protein